MKMKNLLTAITACSLLALPVSPVLAHADHGKPQYGGVVAEGGEAQFEVLEQGGKIVVHVSSHGTPLDTTGASGKLTTLVGAAKTEIELKPASGSRLEGAGKLPAGAKLLLQVQLAGKKALQARAVAP